jgi:hypothetical protein
MHDWFSSYLKKEYRKLTLMVTSNQRESLTFQSYKVPFLNQFCSYLQ